MDQWDESRQDWTEPDRAEGPLPGTRTARVAVVTAVAVVLCVAAGVGIWAWARDAGADTSGAGSPDGSWPSASYGSTQNAAGETAGTAGSGDVPSDPCAALSSELEQKWELQRDTTMTEPGCRWVPQGDRTHFIVLRYSDTGPAQWDSISPITVDGVPSATSHRMASRCMIQWPTSFGSASVAVNALYNAGGRDLCDIAADFTAAVAPNVPR
ncbi:DUF3558 domain-containing protein [Streptomyces piniterrae]|uniref:DUF3558 domain-containing protein n=1 Tax=Streptomyces piniterrae TaxID=2571125 RepID=A0A4U0NJ89_9ACTN|nr:DUF3558 family protein [Streptomyces piniterrae]TJZ54349.1 DUF3558 domain-containing protein [Streptomyces piniterrae]